MASFQTDRQADWVSYREALGQIVDACPALPPERVDLTGSAGLAVAAQIHSPLTLPPGPTSHMDGYAVRTRDLSTETAPTLRVVGTSRPGVPWTEVVPEGGAVRIMTGALVPPEADTIVPVEETAGEDAETGTVRLPPAAERGGAATPGRHIRPAGQEVQRGDLLASPGDTITFGLLALLAVTGEASVAVHPAPAVALLVTGDELVPAGNPDALEGGVRKADLLSPTLPLLVRHAGGRPLSPRRVPDDPAAIRTALQEASEEADVLLTTGGASMGETDRVKDVLEELGFELDFWRIRMRPGSPVSFGRLPRTGDRGHLPVLGLPGNPVSALVTALVLAGPAIRARGGHRRRFPLTTRAIVREELSGPDHLTRFLRVALTPEGSGAWGARPAADQGSGVVRSMALADGLAVIPEGVAAPGPGESVEVLVIPRGGWDENR